MSWRGDWERLHRLENPRDGYADRYFNRHLSRPITLLLSRTSVTPNAVTALCALIGVTAGVVIAGGGYWKPVVGALLLQLSAVFDDVDGELARLKEQYSDYGELFDVTADTITHLAVFIGIAVAVARDSGPAALYVAGTILVAGVLVSFGIVTYLEQRYFPTAPATPEATRLRQFVELLSGRDSSVIVLAFALTGQLEWFLWAAALGAHVFWIAILWLWGQSKGTE